MITASCDRSPHSKFKFPSSERVSSGVHLSIVAIVFQAHRSGSSIVLSLGEGSAQHGRNLQDVEVSSVTLTYKVLTLEHTLWRPIRVIIMELGTIPLHTNFCFIFSRYPF